MSWIDIALCLVILFGAFRGYRDGFLMTVITFSAIILGIAGGFKLMGNAMLMLSDNFDINKSVLPYVAFAVVFVAIVVLVSFLGRLLKSSIDNTFLGRIDQAMGAFIGIFKMMFLISIVLWILSSLSSGLPKSWESQSRLYPIVADFAPLVISWISAVIPAFKDIL